MFRREFVEALVGGAVVMLILSVFPFQRTAQPESGMEIVSDGRAIAKVVVELEEESDMMAAQVLVDWVRKMTDVELPIVSSVAWDETAIYIGEAAVKAGLQLDDIDSPSQEGLRIVAENKRVLLAGQSPTATVRAVCRLLEEWGCRYFMEGPLGEVYPRLTTLCVGPLNITEKPGFLCRKIWGSRWTGQTLWKIWNGAGGLPLHTGHSWGRYVPKALFKDHPEYFRLRDGGRAPSPWLCTSNPEVRVLFAENVIEAVEKGDTHPSISPPDGTSYCECPSCRAQDDPHLIEPSSGCISMSNRFADFFNDIAERVGEVYPDSILSFYCYADYTQPPTLVRYLAQNLCPWIAPIRYCRLHAIGDPICPSRRQLKEVIEGWAAIANRFGYRTYNYNLAECTVPFSKISIWKHDIPYLRERGCIGINFETLSSWHIYGPHIYLSIRLAYEPDADADAIMDDYFLRFFGPRAGTLMKEYWMSIDHAFAKLPCHSGSFYAVHLVYTPEFLRRCHELLDAAAEAVKDDPVYAQRVRLHAEGLRNAEQYVQIVEAMNRGDFGRAKEIYDHLLARNEALVQKGYASHYTSNYIRRFLGRVVEQGAKIASPPNRVIGVLPDTWRLAYDDAREGVERGYHRPEYDDSSWLKVATYTRTLNAQGLPDRQSIMWYRVHFRVPSPHERLLLFFAEIDGAAEVYVNGRKVGEQPKPRVPFEVEITDLVRENDNVVAVRVDHSRITELFLGGIIRPVLLIER
jgi:hypothetical protein